MTQILIVLFSDENLFEEISWFLNNFSMIKRKKRENKFDHLLILNIYFLLEIGLNRTSKIGKGY